MVVFFFFLFFFQIDVELIAYDKKVKNDWNVIRWYMVKDNKKLATEKKNPTIARITA